MLIGIGWQSEFGTKDFSNDYYRQWFTRRIYIILALQLLLIIVFVWFINYQVDLNVKQFFRATPILFHIGLCAFIIIGVILVFLREFRRKIPINYLSLIIFTIIETIFLGLACITFKPEYVLLFIGNTALVTLTMALTSFGISFDKTSGVILATVYVMAFCTLPFAFLETFRMVGIIYCSLAVLMFSVHVIFDIQLMMEDSTYTIFPEEYVFATLNLYTDIFYIPLYVYYGWQPNLRPIIFTDSERLHFVGRFYITLFVQALLTMSFIALFAYEPHIKSFFHHEILWVVFSAVIFIIIMIILAFYSGPRRKPMMNYGGLAIFTIQEGVFLGIITASFDFHASWLIVGAVAALGLGMAFQTRIMFSNGIRDLIASLVVTVIIVFIFLIIVSALINYGQVVHLSIVFPLVLLLLWYILFYVKLVIECNHFYPVAPDEYVFAALNVYISYPYAIIVMC